MRMTSMTKLWILLIFVGLHAACVAPINEQEEVIISEKNKAGWHLGR